MSQTPLFTLILHEVPSMRKLHIFLLIFFVLSSPSLFTTGLRGETGDIIKTIVTEEAQLNALAFDGQGDLWLNRPVSLQSYLFEVDPWGKTKTEFSSTYTEYTGIVWSSPFLYALSTSSPNRIHLLNLEQQKIVGDIRTPEEHCSLLAFDGNFFWTFSGTQKKLIKLNWQGNQIGTLNPVDEDLTGLAFKDGVLWQLSAGAEKSTIYKTDPETGEVLASFDVDKKLENLTFYSDNLWVVEYFQGNAYQVESEILSSQNIAYQWNLKGNLLIQLTLGNNLHLLSIPFREEFLLKSDGSCTGIALEGQWQNSFFTVDIELDAQDFGNDFLFPLLLSLGYSDLNPEDIQFEAESTRIPCMPLFQLAVWGLPHMQGHGFLGGTYQDLEYTFNAVGIVSGEILSIN